MAAGAKLVDFAGWEMPVQYEGVRQEHVAVRTGCGVFDVSHMGEIQTSGPGALDLLQRLLSNDVAKIEVGGAQYSVLCRDDGGVLDDLFTYRLADDRYLTVTNASNHERDLGWFLRACRGVRRRDHRLDRATGRCSPSRARMPARSPRRRLERSCRRGCAPPGSTSPRRTLSCAAPATRARTASRSWCRPESATELWDALVSGGRDARRAGRARHAAPRGVLSPLRQRPVARTRPDRRRARLVLQGGDGLHRLRGRRQGPCRGDGAEAGPVRR